MGTNAAQFESELKQDIKKLRQEFKNFRADLVGDVLSVAAGRTPVGKTKKLVRSWGANAGGGKPNYSLWGGSLEARNRLRTARVDSTIYMGNSHFTSSWFEKGTQRGLRARRMLQVGVEAVKDRKA